MAETKQKIFLSGVVKIPELINKEIDMESARLGIYKYEVVLRAWSVYKIARDNPGSIHLAPKVPIALASEVPDTGAYADGDAGKKHLPGAKVGELPGLVEDAKRTLDAIEKNRPRPKKRGKGGRKDEEGTA